ncbi:MAG: hypothetical protein LBN21_04315 [Treponema sp.]|jgi:hypothetical protein|nr:hypothetical protein [Treponema sp.]
MKKTVFLTAALCTALYFGACASDNTVKNSDIETSGKMTVNETIVEEISQ